VGTVGGLILPWDLSAVEKHNKGLSKKQKEQWVAAANSSRESCLKKGKTEKECDAQAIRIANAVVKAHGGPGSGHFGHKGRPGVGVGGSAPGGGKGQGKRSPDGKEKSPRISQSEYDRRHSEFKAGLSPDQEKAINSYSSTEFMNINDSLRESEGRKDEIYEDDWDNIKNIDNALRTATPIDRDVKLYRGIQDPEYVFPNGLKPGQRVYDYAYLSTTTLKKHAELYTDSDPELSMTMEIKVKKGTKLAFTFEPEREVLLPRSTRSKKNYLKILEVRGKYVKAEWQGK
jgi:hypothetical protein